MSHRLKPKLDHATIDRNLSMVMARLSSQLFLKKSPFTFEDPKDDPPFYLLPVFHPSLDVNLLSRQFLIS